MVTVELTNYQARMLRNILRSDIEEFEDGIEHLEEIRMTDPDRLLGKRMQTPDEAIRHTESAIRVLTHVRNQLRYETKA